MDFTKCCFCSPQLIILDTLTIVFIYRIVTYDFFGGLMCIMYGLFITEGARRHVRILLFIFSMVFYDWCIQLESWFLLCTVLCVHYMCFYCSSSLSNIIVVTCDLCICILYTPRLLYLSTSLCVFYLLISL